MGRPCHKPDGRSRARKLTNPILRTVASASDFQVKLAARFQRRPSAASIVWQARSVGFVEIAAITARDTPSDAREEAG
jgi:hypothetical protein